MDERGQVFWAKFSHEWWLISLAALVLALAALAVVSRQSKHHGGSPGWRRTLFAARALTVIAAGLFLYSQMHLPCAALASFRSQCVTHVKRLASAQLLYAADNDERILVTEDWVLRVGRKGSSEPKQFRCPGAEGPVSYAVNAAFLGRPLTEVEEPGKTVLLFDADTKAVCGQSCLAQERHLGRPTVAMADGLAKSVPARFSGSLVWELKGNK